MSSGTSNRSDSLTTFHVYVDGFAHAVFTEISGLDIEVEVTDVPEGGVNSHIHRLPGRVKVSDVTLRNGITSTNELWIWYSQVLHGQFIRRNLSIVMVDQFGTERHRWSFDRALPVKWTGPQFKMDQSTVAVQSLQLTHEGLVLDSTRTF